MTQPLDGIKVLEVAIYAFAPSAAAILSDWGADVIKVEHPSGGDPGRRTAAWGVPQEVNGVSHLWEAVNRGKRAVALDIADPSGHDVLMRLVDECDVFICNFLPAARRKLGIDVDVIRARNPRVIYARASAQGSRGDLAERGGFDGISYWGRSGAAIGVTPPESAVPLTMPGPGFGDLQSGMALAGGIGTALFNRERTGEGAVVDASLLASGLWAMGMTISGTSVLNTDRLPHQYHHMAANPAVNYYRTSDDEFIALAFLQADRYWGEFCVLVDRLDWITDERLCDSEARKANSEFCVRQLADLFAERTQGEWQDLLAQQDGQWDVLLSAGHVVNDQQVQDNRFVQRVRHDAGGAVNLVVAPIQFNGEAPELGRAPRLGEHTDEVLLASGLTASDIAELRDRGVIASHSGSGDDT